jgi:hypothetical protein
VPAVVLPGKGAEIFGFVAAAFIVSIPLNARACAVRLLPVYPTQPVGSQPLRDNLNPFWKAPYNGIYCLYRLSG